jgi:hypothetical protein
MATSCNISYHFVEVHRSLIMQAHRKGFDNFIRFNDKIVWYFDKQINDNQRVILHLDENLA